jgi:O-antigen biosynthesis protein
MSGVAPVKVLEVELSRPAPSGPAGAGESEYGRALVLVRLHDEPLGLLELELGGTSAEPAALVRRIVADLAGGSDPGIAARLAAHLRRDGLAGDVRLGDEGAIVAPAACAAAAGRPEQPRTTVVVATRDRPDQLAGCLASLLAMDHPRFDIVVVDSAPTTTATRETVERCAGRAVSVRYVCEKVPGLARARNRGVAAATGDVVAFTDDDVSVDRRWLSELTGAFSAGADIACATGLSLPAELETPAQVWFEEFGGFAKGFERQVFDADSHRAVEPLYPYRVGWFGSGLNMAFDAAALRRLGGFDEHLGAGTRVHGGEDLDAFLRVILAGRRLVYEPRALVWHYHRRDEIALRRQLRGSGVGLSAVLTKLVLDRATRGDVLAKAVRGFRYLLSPSSPKNARKTADFPKRLTAAELLGVASGPFVYAYSRWRDRPQGNAG